MKIPVISALAAFVLLGAFTACDDNVSEIGSSLTGDQVSIIIDSAFTVSGHSEAISAIRPKTTTQMLGQVNLPSYGSISSSAVSQFLPSTELDTANFAPADVDSLILILRYAYQSFIGDSVAPMGLKVYALDKQLPRQIASDFDPTGYYNSSAPLASTVFNATSMGSDSIAALSYRDIRFKLPRELGRSLFQSFIDNPSYYANGQIFAEKVFPGIFIDNYFGSGRLTLVAQTFMTMHMRHIEYNTEEAKLDTLDAVHQYYMVTPEVINNNNLSIKLSGDITDRLAQGKTMLVGPAGYEVDFEFPTREIISRFRSHQSGAAVVNGLTMSIPADSIANSDGVTAPPYVLMVLKKDRDAFFADNKLPDNKTSFYASYNSTTQTYSFSSLRSYILNMLDKETIEDEDCQFCLVPVQVNTESTSSGYYYGTQEQTVTEVLPYLTSPVAAVVRFEDAKIKLTYSLQTQK